MTSIAEFRLHRW